MEASFGFDEFGVVLIETVEDVRFAELREHVDEIAEFFICPGFGGVAETDPLVVDVLGWLAGAREEGADLVRGFAEVVVGPGGEFGPGGVLTIFEGGEGGG